MCLVRKIRPKKRRGIDILITKRNQIMIKILPLLLIIVCLNSCKGQDYQTEPFDLSTLSFSLNSEKLYSKSMNRENIKFTSGKQYVEKDTINDYDLDLTGSKDKIFGIQYNVTSWSPKDTVAFYKNLTFSRFSTMTTEKGDLMLVSATGDCSDENFKSFIQKLTAEYANPKIEKREFSLYTTYHYTWTIKDRIVQLVSRRTIDFNQAHSILTEKDKKEIMEVDKYTKDEIHLFICRLDFEEKLRGKMIQGDYSQFK